MESPTKRFASLQSLKVLLQYFPFPETSPSLRTSVIAYGTTVSASIDLTWPRARPCLRPCYCGWCASLDLTWPPMSSLCTSLLINILLNLGFQK